MAPTTVTITGSIYHPSTGAKIKAGTLYITPRSFIISNGELVSKATIAVSVPSSGDLSFSLVPSHGSVYYDVEFDPDPADTSRPRKLKPGYFTDTWNVPASGPVNISTLG